MSPAPRAALRLALLLAFAFAFALPGIARAGSEEFSTFDIHRQEEDDESLLDHVLTRAPRAWRDDWERAAQAFRTQQGCLTSGQWFIQTDLKMETPLGDTARFGVHVRQSEDDVANYNYLDLSTRFPTRFGIVGASIRPLFDKSRQDLALLWELGADTSAVQLQTAFGFEDLFNNLWAFRQSRVGDRSEPYERHPFEPAVRLVTRQPRFRTELEGKYLTPSRRRVPGATDLDPPRYTTLWGTRAGAAVEYHGKRFVWEARTWNQQAFSSDAIAGAPFGVDGNFRRQWQAETAVRVALPSRVHAEARFLYQDRDQHHGPPLGPGAFGAIDRLIGGEIEWQARPKLATRAGYLHDHITVARSGLPFGGSYGTRIESRFYLGLTARFGRVVFSAVEGIELDPEPYDVWLVHDKGFLQLQATF